MKVNRIEKHIINKNHKMYKLIDEYCYKSKNLYNYANYMVRQEFINNENYIGYPKSSKLLKHTDIFKDIGSNSGQMTLKMLHQNWKSYFASIKDWSKNKSKYLGKPSLPTYLEKENGRYVFIMTNMQSQIKDGFLYFAFKPFKPFNNLIKTRVKDKHMQTRFVPKSDHYIIEIVYEKEVEDIHTESRRVIGIDLGLNRFATIQNNIDLKPFAINGGELKAINNYYNKRRAHYSSIAQKVNGRNKTKRMQKISTKRTNKIDNFLHKASRYIVDYCIENDIDTVIVGYNKKWKQEINIGKKNNQKFVQVPFYKFINQLEYKCQDVGIHFVTTEESYTSKASFLDLDKLERGDYSGKRIKRGLYKSREGILINADVNGAGNIIRKVYPNAFADGLKGVHLHPEIINL